MRNTQRGFVVLLLLVVIALLLAGGAYIWLQQKQVSQSETGNSTTKTTSTASQSTNQAVTQPSFNVSKSTVESGGSITFSWSGATSFGGGACPSGITLYDETNNKNFLCRDGAHPVSTSGSDTIRFTNTSTDTRPIQIAFLLNTTTGSPPLIQTITVTSPTTAVTFSASPTSGSAPLKVKFSINVSCDGKSHAIDYGDGQAVSISACPAQSGPNTSSYYHIYTSAGTYTVRLYTSAGVGVSGTATINVQ